MRAKQPQPPMVSSVTATLRKTINATQVSSEEEIVAKKREILGVLDSALDKFKANLENGTVPLNSTLDLERIVKLRLLVSGEADTIAGTPNGQIEQELSTGLSSASISMSKVDEILSLDDPTVQAMYDMLYNGYNQQNDIDD